MAEQIVPELKRCPCCKISKPKSEFYFQNRATGHLKSACKPCSCRLRIEGRMVPRRALPVLDAHFTPVRRFCFVCGEWKAPAGFRVRGRNFSVKHCQCTPCRKAPERVPEKKLYRRDYEFRLRYGISLAIYDEMLCQQKGVCAICLEPEKRPNRWLAVDHCHTTGKVRALLCSRCNRLIGQWNDSPAIAQRAADYLRKHSQLKLVI